MSNDRTVNFTLRLNMLNPVHVNKVNWIWIYK